MASRVGMAGGERKGVGFMDRLGQSKAAFAASAGALTLSLVGCSVGAEREGGISSSSSEGAIEDPLTIKTAERDLDLESTGDPELDELRFRVLTDVMPCDDNEKISEELREEMARQGVGIVDGDCDNDPRSYVAVNEEPKVGAATLDTLYTGDIVPLDGIEIGEGEEGIVTSFRQSDGEGWQSDTWAVRVDAHGEDDGVITEVYLRHGEEK